jgi:hypothetical protein
MSNLRKTSYVLIILGWVLYISLSLYSQVKFVNLIGWFVLFVGIVVYFIDAKRTMRDGEE